MAATLGPQTPSKLRIAVNASLSSRATYRSFPSPTRLSPIRPASLTCFSSTPPPAVPAAWIWSCHLCHSTFPLGATRRCLHDGHYFCAGASVNVRTGRVRRHKPCGSVFDYDGWERVGEWRQEEQHLQREATARATVKYTRTTTREVLNLQQQSNTHNCWIDCNYPSECRWRPHFRQQKRVSTEASGDLGLALASSIHDALPLSPISPPDSDSSSSSSSGDVECDGKEDPLSPISPDDTLLQTSLELDAWPQPPQSQPIGRPTTSSRLLSNSFSGSGLTASGLDEDRQTSASTSLLDSHNPQSNPTASRGLDLDPAEAELAWYQTLALWADESGELMDEKQAPGPFSQQRADVSNARAHDFKDKKGTKPVEGRDAPRTLWDWSVGGLSSLRQLGIGLGGEIQ